MTPYVKGDGHASNFHDLDGFENFENFASFSNKETRPSSLDSNSPVPKIHILTRFFPSRAPFPLVILQIWA